MTPITWTVEQALRPPPTYAPRSWRPAIPTKARPTPEDRIIAVLRVDGDLTYHELMRATGLGKSTVFRAISDLTAQHAVEKVVGNGSCGGKPACTYRVASRTA